MHEPTAGRAMLAVLGAGPKGLAIAAKRAALARSGGEVPDLVLVDREGVAANRSGAAGYTDGRQRLSTAPEKDVGFPYAHTWGAASERVSQEVGRWSWQSYLVHQEGFADWADRGGLCPPTASGASICAGSPRRSRPSRSWPRWTASTSPAAAGASPPARPRAAGSTWTATAWSSPALDRPCACPASPTTTRASSTAAPSGPARTRRRATARSRYA